MYEGQLKRFPETVVIEFIEPLKGESLVSYIKRFAQLINTDEPFQLLGVSLGGIFCMELAKVVQPERIIIISSVKTRTELPLFIRFFKYFPIHKLIHGKFYIYAFLFLVKLKAWFTRRNIITAKLRDMAKDAPPKFVTWAVHQVIIWENEAVPNNVVHIHGNSDFLFPIRRLKVDQVIDKGTHAMILTHGKKINFLLERYLSFEK